MTSFLAPESPRPFSVAAERYFQQINPATGFNIRPTHDRSHPTSRCRFGEQYEREFSFYLAKHAEVNCSDRLCLVGEEPEWASIVQERLFLIKPVHFIDCKLHQGMSHSSCGEGRFNQIPEERRVLIRRLTLRGFVLSASWHFMVRSVWSTVASRVEKAIKGMESMLDCFSEKKFLRMNSLFTLIMNNSPPD